MKKNNKTSLITFKQINFSPSFPLENMLGILVYPVKEQNDDDGNPTIVQCEESDAQAWTIQAQLADDGQEFLADCKKKQDALQLQVFIQSIWLAAKSTIKKPRTWALQNGEEIIAIIDETTNTPNGIKKLLSMHFNGEITHISEPVVNRHLQGVFTVICREENGTDEIFNGDLKIIPVQIYSSEG